MVVSLVRVKVSESNGGFRCSREGIQRGVGREKSKSQIFEIRHLRENRKSSESPESGRAFREQLQRLTRRPPAHAVQFEQQLDVALEKDGRL